MAEWVADGPSNKEVASALFTWLRTVEVNLSKVCAKLGIRYQTESAPLVGRSTQRQRSQNCVGFHD